MDEMLIPFTQYHLPDGRPDRVEFECDDVDVYNRAKKLLASGYTFDAEVLSTGLVSFTCEKEDDLAAIELSKNGPEVVEKVAALINIAYALMEEKR